jgi:4-carboxymuconolactone decarboxylase
MHLPHPRIPALTDAQLTPEQREALLPASYPGTPPLNIFRTLAHAPDALRAFLAWGTYILRNPPSLCELRRTGALVRRSFSEGGRSSFCAPAISAAPAMNGRSTCASVCAAA